jgi:hypothetical protein
MRKTSKRKPTIATNAKTTPRAYDVSDPVGAKNLSSLSSRRVVADEKVVKRTIDMPALGKRGKIPGSICTKVYAVSGRMSYRYGVDKEDKRI